MIRGFGKLRQAEYLERQRFQLLVENRDPYIQLLWDKRNAGSLKDFLTARGLLKGQGLHRAYCSGERTGRQNCPGALCPAGREHSQSSGAPAPWLAMQLLAPHPPDTQPAMTTSWPDPPGLQTSKPILALGQPEGSPTYSSYKDKHRGLYLYAQPTGYGTGDRHSGQKAGNSSFLPPSTNTALLGLSSSRE